MTLLRLKTLAIALCISGLSYAQTTNAFRVNYNQALFDLPGNAVEALTANNYLFAGTNMNFLPIYGTVTQVNDIGTQVWSKSYYDGSLGFQLNDIKKDAGANEYYLCGGSESNAGVFMRIDAAGNVVVSKKFSISQADGAYFNRVIKTADGGYVAVGYVTGLDPDGAGPEIDFAPITYTDANGDSQTEVIGSPLIVKMDANGNHLWHKVFRYYTAAAKNPTTQRIYNDAAFNDVVETSDGYIAVGQYDVNNHLSNTNSDGDDATATDALILKTDFVGTITYHKQFDAVSSTPTQNSKYLSAISKTSTGVPIAAGTDNSKEWITKFGAAGAWSLTFSRLFTYPGFLSVADISQVYEVNGGTDIVTMGMYISPLSFLFSNSLHRVNSTATTNVWGKYYTFSLATILPRGSQVSDNGFIMNSTVMGGANFDYHLIKTDPTGDTPLAGCAPTSISPTAAAGATTIADPFYNFWSGTVGSQVLAITAANITPASSVQCSFVPCTPPSAPVVGTITQPTCSVSTGSVALSGLPTPGTWTVTASPGGATITGTGTTANFTGLAANTYTFTVTLSGCTSVASASAIVTPAPAVPATPVIGTITQTTCSTATGSVALSGLPAGSWTVTASPGGATLSGSGTTGTFTGLAPGTYTFTVAASAGTTTLFSEDFETGGPGWTLNVSTGPEGADANFFQIDDDEGGVAPTGCGVANNNDETLHITSVFNPAGGAAYDAGGLCGFLFCPQANKRAESPAVNSVGQSGLTLNFNYIAKGDIPNDQATVWYNDGTGWYQLGAALNSPICGGGQGQWSAYSSVLPASCNNIANLKVAIRWVNNDDGAGTDPSVAINNLTITAAGAGCSSLASVSATINPQPTVPTAPIVGAITQPTCSVSTGSVALSGLPASGTWTLTATPGGTTSTGTGTTGTFAGLPAGTTYTFTVTNAGGCISTASTSAAINTAPTAASAPIVGTITQPTCAVSTGSVALSGLPATGSWTVTASPGGTTTTGSGTTTTFSGLTANTTYTFTVTNASGCTSSASTSALLNAAPSPATTPIVGTITQPSCSVSTGSVDFNGLPASGTWTLTANPGGTTSTGTGTTGTFAGLTAGTTYTFTVTNAGGCTSTATTSAALNAAPTPANTPITGTITQPTCSLPNGTVDLSGLPASGTWTVTANPGAIVQTGTGSTATFGSLPAGNSYSFTVTNSAGCTSSASTSAVINSVPGAPTTPVIGTITQPTCAVSTGSVDLSGLPSSGTWTLTTTPGGTTTGTGTTTSISGLAAGTSYTFMVTNDLGCTSSSSSSAVIIAQPITPIAPIVGSITQPTCTVATGDVSISGLPSTGTWTITSTPGGLTQTGTGTTGTFTGLSANTYTFTVTNSDGCTSTVSSTSATINTQPATPSAPIAGSVTQPTCLSPTGSVDVSGLPATGTWTLTSAPGGISQTGTGTTATFNGLAAGATYTLTVTNSAGCTSVSSASVVVNSVPGAPTAPTAGTITQPTCALPTGTIEVASPLGANFTYSIDGTTFQAGTTFSGLNPGNYTITVLDNTSGCSSVSTASVTIDPVAGAPSVSLVTSTSVTCIGDTDGALEISVTGGIAPYTYAWTPNVGSGNTLTNIAAGSYDVTVTDDAGCSATATFTVGSPTAIAVNGVETNVICGSSDGSITTAVSGGTAPYTYAWTPNNEITSGLTGLAAGNYSVLVTDDNGCTATESFIISTTGLLPVDIDPSYALIDAGETVQLTVTGGQNYTWTPATGLSCTDCANPIASPTTSTTYYVTATDPNGCTGGDTILIEIKMACGEIFVPTAFSPNDKGPSANNMLCVYGTPACIKELLFQVYDRWGEVVFETTDITKCWNGMYKDKMMNSGIYVYRLYAELTNGDIVDTSGNTTLVR
jgi:gliding motility-associated-like protein